MEQDKISQNDVIEMAIKVGFTGTASEFYMKALEHFAKLVEARTAAKEREACIQIVENEAYQYSAPVWAFEIVNAIKDRGEAT